jgi:hypothetical protein
MVKNIIKAIIFVALALGFFWFAGRRTAGQVVTSPAWARAGAWFLAGAAVALWGDKDIGVTIDPDPISLRSVFVVLGVLMMIFGAILMKALCSA